MPTSTSAADIAALIDHTILSPTASAADIARCCKEALRHGFASVCVNGVHVSRVAERLAGSAVRTCSVIGFPLGAAATAAKADEAARAVADGADEIDMVIDIGALKAGDDARVRADIAAVKVACDGRLLKVIVETCLLSDEEKRLACRLAVEAGADFVKTSTGFSTGGATIADVALMREVVGPSIGVKASGGVRSLADLRAMVEAGATRIGASAGVAIVTQAQQGSRDEARNCSAAGAPATNGY